MSAVSIDSQTKWTTSIVATDAGGNAEIVRGRENGLVVPDQRPEVLAAALAKITAMAPEARKATGPRLAAHVVSNYDIERIADEWLGIYEAACAGVQRT